MNTVPSCQSPRLMTRWQAVHFMQGAVGSAGGAVGVRSITDMVGLQVCWSTWLQPFARSPWAMRLPQNDA
jgi:hypothetical protein